MGPEKLSSSLQALLGVVARCCTPAAVLGGTQLILEKLEAGTARV